MTEVPEHLLRRAKERRAALTGGAAPAPADAAPASESATAPVPAETTPAPAAAPAAAAAPAITGPPPLPSAAALADQAARRTRVPLWVTPVLLVIPFWAVLYAGAFGDRAGHEEVDPLQLGAEVFRSSGCAGCHGAAGEGGVGPALAGGSVEQTFPEVADHIAWVRSGSIGTPQEPTPYGSPDRPDGQRLSKGGMPSFPNLTQEQVEAVVRYEREQL